MRTNLLLGTSIGLVALAAISVSPALAQGGPAALTGQVSSAEEGNMEDRKSTRLNSSH